LVGALSRSPATTSAYAVAREVVTSLSKIRQGFDQVLAPVAAELHAAHRRDELAAAATMSARWGLVLAAPLALVFFVFPELVLSLFGAHDGAVAVALALLAVGRLVDTATGPTSIVLAMVGRPRLVLLDAAAGVVVAAAGAALLGPWLGPAGVAAAASLGLVAVNALALTWLARLERLHPVNAGLAAPAAVVVLAGLALVGVRLAAGAALTIPLVTLAIGWLAAYVATVAALGFLPAAWTPWRRTPVEVLP
jgi:O-antigen/teichoic acid export membrane protein